jgi:hypothetical protein
VVDDRPSLYGPGISASASERATLVVTGTIITVAALVSVIVENHGTRGPFLFMPDDFRRFGVEPRPGDRWTMHLAVDLDGQSIRGVRLVGLAAP